MIKWINVNDKLPELYSCVLACNVNGISQNERDCFIAGYAESGWYEFWSFGEMNKSTVTHWMPLPELPEPNKD